MIEKRFYIQDEKTIKDNKKYITENGYVLSFKNDAEELCDLLNILVEENEQLQKDCTALIYNNQEYRKENKQLKSENKRLTDKLNKTALELVDECISQGKATEISEMSYREFLDYRAKNGKPMELQL